ncbi:MAG: InlB B-repeat-containing protein [Clostridia bacterium]|nr:InlB B-repeat-containing protein [Clostridia bacterium]
MKKAYTLFAISSFCLLLFSCNSVRQPISFTPTITDRTAAVVDIVETERSKIDLPETGAVTQPQYFEVVATGTTAQTTKKQPTETEAPKEYFTVKFVDTDGYTSISVQTVVEGGSAVAPQMPGTRGELVFRGWDKPYNDIRRGTIVKAIYQKEFLTVNFYDNNGALLKTEQVRYGESATPPEMPNKEGYLFDGWNKIFSSVTDDMDIYATYYALP